MAPFLGGAGAPAPNGLPSNGPAILCIDWAFFSLSTIIVLLRLFTRTFIVPSFGWDDTCIALAQLMNVVGKCLTIEEVANGLGLHEWQIPPADYSRYLKYNYLDWCQVFITLALAKISICLFLLRLSQFEKLRFLLYGLIAFIALTHLPLFFLIAFQCNPVSKNWHPDRPGSCFSRGAIEGITNAQGVISIIIDFICVGFPIVLLRKTSIRGRTKLGLSLLMGLGVLTAIACIVRVCYSWQIQATDVTWVGLPNALSRIAEVNLGNIAACIPVLKPFFRWCRARITGNDPHNILHHRATTVIPSPQSSDTASKPSMAHGHWYSKYIPTLHPSRRTDAKRRRRQFLSGSCIVSSSASENPFKRSSSSLGGPYTEISKSSLFTQLYCPDTTSTTNTTTSRSTTSNFHRTTSVYGGGDHHTVPFDFSPAPDSPRSPGQVHERVDKEKGIVVDTDIMVEHVEEVRR